MNDKRRVLLSRNELAMLDAALVTYHSIESVKSTLDKNTAIELVALRKKLLSNILHCEGLGINMEVSGADALAYNAAPVSYKMVKKSEESRLAVLQHMIETGAVLTEEENAELMELLGM